MPSHPGVASEVASSTGTATLRVQHNKTGIIWDIQQISISTTPDGPLNVEVQFNAFPLLTPTAMVSGATAQGEPSIQIADHDILYFYVTGATPSSTITLAYYYDERSSGLGAY